MCGIAGLIHRGKSSNVGHELQGMLQALKHRGEDSTGYALYGDTDGKNFIMRFKVGENVGEGSTSVAEDVSVYDERKKIVDRFNHWENVYTKMGITTWPIVLMGALPQDRKNENLKVLVAMGDNAKIVLEDTDDIDDALEIKSSFAAA